MLFLIKQTVVDFKKDQQQDMRQQSKRAYNDRTNERYVHSTT
jgi:hypothetical protein